ncbi:MAG: hypothetical protein OCD00_19500 [Colwellia sp.]
MAKSRKRRKKKPVNDAIMIPEYYKIVFAQIHEKYEAEIHQKCVIESEKFRHSISLNVRNIFNVETEDQQHITLMKKLDKLESELKNTIEKHSVFYWIHLYRRIAPCLASDLGGNTNESTTITVRNHVEQAIFKYSDLSKNDDYALSSEVDFNDILGGMLIKSMKRAFSKKVVDMYATNLKNSNVQWVLTKFSEEDILDIYYIEGLAYQYWYISAKMRALGKGIKLKISKSGDIFEDRTVEQELLITSFDKRDEENSPKSGLTSNLGTFTPSKINSVNDTILCAFLNPVRYTLKDFGIKGMFQDFSPNYIPWYVNSLEYYSSHKYLEKFFEKKYKFGFLEFCQIATVFSHLLVANSSGASTEGLDKSSKEGMKFYISFQRAYNLYGRTLDDIKNEILDYVKLLRDKNNIKPSRLEDQLDDILDFITLDKLKQKYVGLWSNGPKSILVKINDLYLCDYSSWYPLLTNVFFGLRNYDPKSKKGVEFEYAFAEAAIAAGLDVIMQSTEIKFNQKQREVDVAIRVQDRLYLFECRASERPLDFMIGNPKTIRTRCNDFEKKLEQVSTLESFIESNRTGTNYDFSWAKKIFSVVVSPYTEWIWSNEPYFWTPCKNYPRIMSVHEAIEYLQAENEIVA